MGANTSAADNSPRPGSDSWVAAVHASQGDRRPLGSGFLIDGRRVLTCASVVFDGRVRRPELWVAFPKAHGMGYQRIPVKDVAAPPFDERDVRDVAVLTLAQPVPEGYAARLRQPEIDSLVRRRWWTFGFPDGMLGNSSDGVVGEVLGYGWIRLDTGSRYPVKSGYAGAALWSADYEAVVGMVGQAQSANGDARAITLSAVVDCLPDQKLHLLTGWSAEAAGEGALAAWGWSLDRDPEAGLHWRPRARGVYKDSDRGFRFRGRTAALTRIRDWLVGVHPQAQALVVTGSPGVGKSAVLGRVVTTADPAIAAALPRGDDAVRAVERSVACAVHAKGKTALEVAGEIARAASARLPMDVRDLATVLADALERTRRTGFTVIIDALDEAASTQQTRQIIHHIARPLAEDLHHLGVRVVVGTRRQDDDGSLVEAFANPSVIDLDTPEYFARADLAAYALATLQLHGEERAGNPYNDDRVAEPVAERIAELADGNFLVAGLVARARGKYDRTPVAIAELTFTPTVDSALNSYLLLLPRVAGVPAAALMTALAYAKASGVPIDLWRATIGALGYAAPGAEDLEAFARSSAANFLVETSVGELATPVYRLFHQALNDALLRHREAPADEKAITAAFLGLGRESGWSQAPAYLLRSLPAHAQRGHAVDELLDDDAYPLYADLRRLIPAAAAATTPTARRRARLLRKTPRAIDAPPAERAALYTISEVLHDLGSAYRDLAHDSPYRARWAATQRGDDEALLEGHTGPVSALCPVSSPGGRTFLASGSHDHTVRVWDPTTGTQRHVFEGHAGPVNALCALGCADGRVVLASASDDGSVRLWDPMAGTRHHVFEGHAGPVNALCALGCADGRVVLASASDDGSVRLWDPTTGTRHHVLEGHAGPVRALCAVGMPDGSPLLASASDDGTVRLWNPVAGTHERRLRRGFTHGGVRTLYTARLASGPTVVISASADGTLRMWDPGTGRCERLFRGHRGPVGAMCSVETSNGQLLIASASDDRTVRLWDPDPPPPPRLMTRIFGFGRNERQNAIVSGGETAPTSASRRGGARRLKLPVSFAKQVLEGHADAVSELCVVESSDSASLLGSASHDGTVRVWDPYTGAQHHLLKDHTGPVSALCSVATADGRVLLASASHDRTVRLWNPTSSARDQLFERLIGPVSALCAFTSAEGETLLGSASHDGTLRLWDPATGSHMRLLKGHSDSVSALCLIESPGGEVLLGSASLDGTVRLWDPATGTRGRRLKGHTGPVVALCVVRSADGRVLLASASEDGSVCLWDPVSGARCHVLEGHAGPVVALCAVDFGDGRVLLASASEDGSVRLWDPVSGARCHVLEGHAGPVVALCAVDFGDGRVLLASGSQDGTVRLWDPVSGTPGRRLEGHTGPVVALCAVDFGDGRVLLASASQDGTVRLWDPASGARRHVLEGHTGPLTALCTAPAGDGRRLLASASHDRTVRLWDGEGALVVQIPVGSEPRKLVDAGCLVIALDRGVLAVEVGWS
ncbi:AAA family ATPase [Streptomyces sp. NPDC007991]|uniref:AAA family ATPase n=1 Tax=Streptomyces sp. NPDC007991 TaxID=3364803 RepID=UPI0036EBA0F6